MKVRSTAEEPIYFDHDDPDARANVQETQYAITMYLEKRGDNELFHILTIDDIADDPNFARQSELRHALYTRGAHNIISMITATQHVDAMRHIIRVNAELDIYCLRNYKDLETCIEEVSSVLR